MIKLKPRRLKNYFIDIPNGVYFYISKSKQEYIVVNINDVCFRAFNRTMNMHIKGGVIIIHLICSWFQSCLVFVNDIFLNLSWNNWHRCYAFRCLLRLLVLLPSWLSNPLCVIVVNVTRYNQWQEPKLHTRIHIFWQRQANWCHCGLIECWTAHKKKTFSLFHVNENTIYNTKYISS